MLIKTVHNGSVHNGFFINNTCSLINEVVVDVFCFPHYWPVIIIVAIIIIIISHNIGMDFYLYELETN